MRNPGEDFVRDVTARALADIVGDALGLPRPRLHPPASGDVRIGSVYIGEDERLELEKFDPQGHVAERVTVGDDPGTYIVVHVPDCEGDGGP